mmetsp:Transcript_23069/g.71905  ORF Transcript_23069/g.71905 Transcript_23069/m.71905 type:complete len:1328 (-) Transcript_23069:4079-8062(-)
MGVVAVAGGISGVGAGGLVEVVVGEEAGGGLGDHEAVLHHLRGAGDAEELHLVHGAHEVGRHRVRRLADEEVVADARVERGGGGHGHAVDEELQAIGALDMHGVVDARCVVGHNCGHVVPGAVVVVVARLGHGLAELEAEAADLAPAHLGLAVRHEGGVRRGGAAGLDPGLHGEGAPTGGDLGNDGVIVAVHLKGVASGAADVAGHEGRGLEGLGADTCHSGRVVLEGHDVVGAVEERVRALRHLGVVYDVLPLGLGGSDELVEGPVGQEALLGAGEGGARVVEDLEVLQAAVPDAHLVEDALELLGALHGGGADGEHAVVAGGAGDDARAGADEHAVDVEVAAVIAEGGGHVLPAVGRQLGVADLGEVNGPHHAGHEVARVEVVGERQSGVRRVDKGVHALHVIGGAHPGLHGELAGELGGVLGHHDHGGAVELERLVARHVEGDGRLGGDEITVIHNHAELGVGGTLRVGRGHVGEGQGVIEAEVGGAREEGPVGEPKLALVGQGGDPVDEVLGRGLHVMPGAVEVDVHHGVLREEDLRLPVKVDRGAVVDGEHDDVEEGLVRVEAVLLRVVGLVLDGGVHGPVVEGRVVLRRHEHEGGILHGEGRVLDEVGHGPIGGGLEVVEGTAGGELHDGVERGGVLVGHGALEGEGNGGVLLGHHGLAEHGGGGNHAHRHIHAVLAEHAGAHHGGGGGEGVLGRGLHLVAEGLVHVVEGVVAEGGNLHLVNLAAEVRPLAAAADVHGGVRGDLHVADGGGGGEGGLVHERGIHGHLDGAVRELHLDVVPEAVVEGRVGLRGVLVVVDHEVEAVDLVEGELEGAGGEDHHLVEGGEAGLEPEAQHEGLGVRHAEVPEGGEGGHLADAVERQGETGRARNGAVEHVQVGHGGLRAVEGHDGLGRDEVGLVNDDEAEEVHGALGVESRLVVHDAAHVLAHGQAHARDALVHTGVEGTGGRQVGDHILERVHVGVRALEGDLDEVGGVEVHDLRDGVRHGAVVDVVHLEPVGHHLGGHALVHHRVLERVHAGEVGGGGVHHLGGVEDVAARSDVLAVGVDGAVLGRLVEHEDRHDVDVRHAREHQGGGLVLHEVGVRAEVVHSRGHAGGDRGRLALEAEERRHGAVLRHELHAGGLVAAVVGDQRGIETGHGGVERGGVEGGALLKHHVGHVLRGHAGEERNLVHEAAVPVGAEEAGGGVPGAGEALSLGRNGHVAVDDDVEVVAVELGGDVMPHAVVEGGPSGSHGGAGVHVEAGERLPGDGHGAGLEEGGAGGLGRSLEEETHGASAVGHHGGIDGHCVLLAVEEEGVTGVANHRVRGEEASVLDVDHDQLL